MHPCVLHVVTMSLPAFLLMFPPLCCSFPSCGTSAPPASQGLDEHHVNQIRDQCEVVDFRCIVAGRGVAVVDGEAVGYTGAEPLCGRRFVGVETEDMWALLLHNLEDRKNDGCMHIIPLQPSSSICPPRAKARTHTQQQKTRPSW